MSRRATIAVVCALLAGCASSEPLDMSLGSADSIDDVVALGGGFVRCGGRRVPREAFVLELRQRARAMTFEQLEAYRVQVWVPREGADDVTDDAEWLLDQLQLAGIGQAVLKVQS